MHLYLDQDNEAGPSNILERSVDTHHSSCSVAFRNMMAEVKRIDILLNRTREDYASRASKTRDATRNGSITQLEDKLDRVLVEKIMNIFQGFKPSGLEKIANAMGFQGDPAVSTVLAGQS